MTLLPPDHPDRQALAAEVHARPPEALDTPARVSYVAVLVERGQRERELEHLARLCRGYGASPPPPDSSHFTADLGPVRLKWERHSHSEFSGYNFTTHGTSPQPFSEPPVAGLPPGCLANIPGQTIFAAHATVLAAAAGEPDAAFLAAQFDGHVICDPGDFGSVPGRAPTCPPRPGAPRHPGRPALGAAAAPLGGPT